MAGILFTSSALDKDGRQFVLDDNILDIHYYSTVGETWDKVGASLQTWHTENASPTDTFDTPNILTDRWTALIDTEGDEVSTVSQLDGSLRLAIERSEGTVGVTSDGKWRLQGDFDIRLYIDFDTYYNEYRSDTHSYLKVGIDNSNAVRVSFTFDGTQFSFDSEKVVGQSLDFFDWKNNGTALNLDVFASDGITAAEPYSYIQITRISGTIKCFAFNSSTNLTTQIGDDVADAIFTGDVFVDIALEAKEFNTVRTSYSKFISVGTITPTLKFFSTVRGDNQDFPERTILAVDKDSLSIIDETDQTLWARLVFAEGGPVPNSSIKVFGCNGAIYCATSDGLVVFDFHRDKIFKYKDQDITVADESISLRNSAVTFRTHLASIGTIADNNLHDVACRTIGADDYIAVTNDLGVTVFRALKTGVSNSLDGIVIGGRVVISENNGLYWSGYDSVNNLGDLSSLSNIVTLAGGGDFNRSTFFDVDTKLNIFGNQINSIDVVTESGADLIAIGTTIGITFIGFSPGTPFTESFSFGVNPGVNPVDDPTFDELFPFKWKIFYSGNHESVSVTRSSAFFTAGTAGVRIQIRDAPGQLAFHPAGTLTGIFQDNVDFTGVSTLYFDVKIENGPGGNLWDAEILVGTTVVKTYKDDDGSRTRLNDFADVSSFTGEQRLTIRLRSVSESTMFIVTFDPSVFYIDNIRTKVGEADHTAMPAGQTNVKEVLLQWDSAGHKIYFSTQSGHGALDLDDRSLDYFILLQNFVPGAEVVSSDFSRIEDEV